MKFISLIDIRNRDIITIDAEKLILYFEAGKSIKQTRLKPYIASILYELFNKHPTPVSYVTIVDVLKKHNLVISDHMRMHRKLSEIRQLILRLCPKLNDIIINVRGIGYSLPLYLKNKHYVDEIKGDIKFTNMEIDKSMKLVRVLINDAINITAKSNVIKTIQGYIIDRNLIEYNIAEKIIIFEKCEQIILKEICMHEADFNRIRINYLLAKLKTYIGLARISEYSISEMQWLDWFKLEIWTVFDKLEKAVKFIENI